MPFSTPAEGCHHCVLWPQERRHCQEHPRLRHQQSLCGVGKVEGPHLTSPEVGGTHRWLQLPPLLLPLQVAATAAGPATPEIGYDLLVVHLPHIHLAHLKALASPMAAAAFCLGQVQLPGAPRGPVAHRSERGGACVPPEMAHIAAIDPSPDQDSQCGPAPC